MKRLLECANRYVRESDWKDLALVKFCLCAMGLMIGLCIPKEKKRIPLFVAFGVFVGTYVPLMLKFGEILKEEFCPQKD